jgi:mercuric ion transport protein
MSRNKTWVFAISGLLIAGNLFYVYVVAPRLQQRGSACSSDAPDACESASRFSRIALWVSFTIYAVGVFSAYVLGPLLMRFG